MSSHFASKIAHDISPYSHFFTTNDGVQLHYRVSGEGKPLILLPGWTGDSSVFHRNYPELNKHFQCISLDYRCHGLSDSPDHGLHISRFAKDLQELIEHLGLDKVSLLAHSMGNTVIWCYISLFGQDKIDKLVFEDEPASLSANPMWTDEEDEIYTGGNQKKNNYWTLVNALEQSWEAAFGIFGDYFPPHNTCPPFPEYSYPAADPVPVDLLSMDNKKHAMILADHMTNDWRDVIPTITAPSLIIAGMASHCSTPKSCEWLHESIKGSQLCVFIPEEYGVHEMHLYNPEKFNRVVTEFLLG